MTGRRPFGLLLAGAISFGYGFAFVEPGQPAWRPLALGGAGVVALAQGGRRAWSGSGAAVRWQQLRHDRAANKVRRRGLNMVACAHCGAVFGSAVLSPRQLLELHSSACREKLESVGPAGPLGDDHPVTVAAAALPTPPDATPADVQGLSREPSTNKTVRPSARVRFVVGMALLAAITLHHVAKQLPKLRRARSRVSRRSRRVTRPFTRTGPDEWL